MKKWIAALLCLVTLFSLAACGKREAEQNTIQLVSGQTYGTGKHSFDFVVTDPDGADTSVTIKTDADMVGAALLELGIVDGENSSYGLYVKTVNGVTLDYDKDGKYWAFYVNGEYALSGVDATPVEDGAIYEMKAE